MTDNHGFTLEDVHFYYHTTPAVQGISCQLAAGKFYGIIGPNGCGKTTLLDLICGYKEPNKGKVQFGKKDLSQYNKKKLAQQIALVPQEFNLSLGFSVEEIVMMGRHPHIPRFGSPSTHDWQMVDQALNDIGLSHLRHKNASELSGGQKQRTIVARALAQQAPYMLFDEATANLDIKYTIQIFDIAKQRVQEQQHTVIAVLHNMNLAAAYCDELLFMHEGCLYTQGATSQVMTSENIAAVFKVRAQVGKDLFNQPNQVSLCYSTGTK